MYDVFNLSTENKELIIMIILCLHTTWYSAFGEKNIKPVFQKVKIAKRKICEEVFTRKVARL